MTWQLDINGGEIPHEHVVAPNELRVEPGQTCVVCKRRVPHPRQATSPKTKPLAYRVPEGEYDAHLETIDAVAELLGIKETKYHRYNTVNAGMLALLQGARLTETDRTDVGDWCVRCGQTAVHTHHRKLRSQGGGDEPANLIRLCLGCHTWAHSNPADAYASGYLVKSWQNPEDIPVGG